jgi:Zn-dependent M16 (insulinase) family peptidase
LIPEKGKTAKTEAKEKEKLSRYKKTLDEQGLEELIRQTRELENYKEIPSTPEELKKLPLLKISDIKKEAEPFFNKEKNWKDVKTLHHDIFTNEIAYIEFLFSANHIPERLIPYLGFLKPVLGYVDTKHYGFTELSNEINTYTGGMALGTSLYMNVNDNDDYIITADVRTKVLYSNIKKAMELIEEIMFSSKLEDEKRLYEIVSEMKSRLKMGLDSSGNSAAALRAMSYYSETAYIREQINGIAFYKFVEKIEKNFESEKENLIKNIRELLFYVFRKENLLICITADEKGYEEVCRNLEGCISKLGTELVEKKKMQVDPVHQNEGFKTSAGIQYVARAGNFTQKGYKYTGLLKVLRVILNYDYLWNNVRVMGGAYGCGSSFSRSGDCYFASYRDPNLSKTNEIYEKIPEYIRKFNVDDRDMTKYIIGTISDMDIPLSPMAKGNRSLSAYMSKISYEQIQKERDQVLQANVFQIQDLAERMEAVLEQNHICAIGNEDKIESEKQLFEKVEGLYD